MKEVLEKGLVYTLPFLITACSSPAQKHVDACLPAAPKEKVLQPYYEFIAENDKVTAAGFCHLSPGLYDKFWDKILEAEETGLPPDASMPKIFYKLEKDQYSVNVTSEEASEIYAAHLAHSLWLEKNKIVPWSLVDYNEKQLEDLLQPRAWFTGWNDKKGEYSFSYILDYSPREAFSVARDAVHSFSDQRTALVDIIKSTRSFLHGSTTYDSEGNFVKKDPGEIVTLAGMEEEKISRYGCQTMSPYVVQLGNALNIPGTTLRGYYSAANHRSALFEFTDQVLAHGDDPYIDQENTPSSELMGSYKFWKENVLIYPIHDHTAAHNSMIHHFKSVINFPYQEVLQQYCKEGRKFLDHAFLDNKFGPFATVSELDALEKKIIVLSKDCRVFPEDNPDHK